MVGGGEGNEWNEGSEEYLPIDEPIALFSPKARIMKNYEKVKPGRAIRAGFRAVSAGAAWGSRGSGSLSPRLAHSRRRWRA